MSRTFALIQPTPDIRDVAASGGQQAVSAIQLRGIEELERLSGGIPQGCPITMALIQTPLWDADGAYLGEQHGVRYEVTIP